SCRPGRRRGSGRRRDSRDVESPIPTEPRLRRTTQRSLRSRSRTFQSDFSTSIDPAQIRRRHRNPHVVSCAKPRALPRAGPTMIRPILKYGAQTLHERAQPVTALTPEVDRLVEDMIETMYAAPGVGLAAPQVGVALRLFVVDLSVGREPAGLIVLI